MNANLDVFLDLFDNGKQLDPVSEIVGKAQIGKRNIPDPFDIDRLQAEPFPVSQRSDNRGFMRRINPVNIQRGFRFSITERLGVFQDFLKNISLTPFPGIQNKSDYDLFSKDEEPEVIPINLPF